MTVPSDDDPLIQREHFQNVTRRLFTFCKNVNNHGNGNAHSKRNKYTLLRNTIEDYTVHRIRAHSIRNVLCCYFHVV